MGNIGFVNLTLSTKSPIFCHFIVKPLVKRMKKMAVHRHGRKQPGQF